MSDGLDGSSTKLNESTLNSTKSILQSKSLRAKLREKRRKLDSIKQQQHANSISQYLLSSKLYNQSQHIALYLASDGEVDLSLLIQKLFTDQKKIYLPIILSPEKATMKFVTYSKETVLKKNCFGILEPIYEKEKDNKHFIAIEQLDLILAPLVGFDNKGNRMGMGGGYYDRALQHLKEGSSHTQFFGIAHELQNVEQLQPQTWDIPLNGIVTEKRLSYF